MEFKEFPKIPRLTREMIITEKIDGTNGLIFVGEFDQEPFLAGSRSRWITPGKSTDNAGFAAWAYEHKDELINGLGPGFHYGEWWGKGIQRGYGLEEKRFSLFNVGRWSSLFNKLDLTKWGEEDRFVSQTCIEVPCCSVVPIIGKGIFNTDTINQVIDALQIGGSYCKPGFTNPEGVVIFHTASGFLFKKTIEKDSEPKSIANGN